MNFCKFEKVSMAMHPEVSEKWVQDQIASDPTILGLGSLVLRDKEKVQPKAGRLDLLLQDPESHRRYEVELQLGKTDESHIIRTIEYWDIERKRYPQFDHCAVIVAEDITARFLNVISLFNGSIPLVAIQMNLLKAGELYGLHFTTVLDEMTRGLTEDEEDPKAVTDRQFWENQSSKEILSMADQLLAGMKPFAPNYQLNYTKFYIGLSQNGQSNNFVQFRPKKKSLQVEIKLDQNQETTARLEAAGFDLMSYDNLWKRYRLKIKPDELAKMSPPLQEFFKTAHEENR